MKVIELKRSRLSKAAGTNVVFDQKVERVSRTVGGKIRTWMKTDLGKSFRVDMSVPEVLGLFRLVREDELSEILGEEDAKKLVEALAVVESVYRFKEESP
jgi:hypothetical protein